MPESPAESLFAAAVALQPPARAAFLNAVCAENADLRKQVERLLAAHAAAGGFLDHPAAAGHAPTGDLDPNATADGDRTEDYHSRDPTGIVLAGKYRLGERIGQGGMGSVWLAHQSEPVKRKVAVKLIKAGMDSKSVLARFEAERQALAVMDHPNIAKVFDGGLHDGHPFFVMELVKGVPITEYCDARKLTPKERLELFVPVCQAIQHAHQKGVIHRDIKPSNVLVALYDDKPVPKVIDFGVAKATGGTLTEQTIETAFGGVVGTPQYMSPEQASLNNLDIDTRSDVYSLGVLLYELLTGSPPFARKELQKAGLLEILRVVREEEPPRPSNKLSMADALPSLSANRGTEPKKLTGLLRNELDWIVMKALEKDRGRRYETANGFAADVNRYLSGEAVLAHPPSTAYRVKKFVRRNRAAVLVAAGFLGLTLVAGNVIYSTYQLAVSATAQAVEKARLADDERQKAEAAREDEQRQRALAERREAEATASKAAALAAEADAKTVLDFVSARVFAAGRPAPRGGLGKDVTLRRAVDAAEPEVGRAFADRPLVEAAVREVLGKTYDDLGEPALAVRQWTRTRDLFDRHRGPAAPDTLRILTTLANHHLNTGRTVEKVAVLEDIHRRLVARSGPDHSDAVQATIDLASGYKAVGRAGDALAVCEPVVARLGGRLGPGQDKMLEMGSMLANLYTDTGRHPDAARVLEREVAIRPNGAAPAREVSLAHASLARVYSAAGRHADAVRICEQLLQSETRAHGPDPERLYSARRGLAFTYKDAGRNADAVKLFEQIVAGHQGRFKRTTEAILFAVDYTNCDRYEDAIRVYEAALRRPEGVGGWGVLMLTSLDNCYQRVGRPEAAVRMWADATAECESDLGADHPTTMLARGRLSSSLIRVGRPAEAVGPLERQLEAARGKHGPDHMETIKTAIVLADAYSGAGKGADAIRVLEGVAGAPPTRDELASPNAFQRWTRLATAYGKAGRKDDAIRVLERLHAAFEAARGPDDPTTLSAAFNLGHGLLHAGRGPAAAARLTDWAGRVRGMPGRRDLVENAGLAAIAATSLLDLRQYAAAEVLARDALAARRKATPDDWLTFNTESMLGGALAGQGKFAEAEPLLVSGYEGMEARAGAIPPQGRSRPAWAADRLCQLYTAWGKPAEAARWRAERAKYGPEVAPQPRPAK